MSYRMNVLACLSLLIKILSILSKKGKFHYIEKWTEKQRKKERKKKEHKQEKRD